MNRVYTVRVSCHNRRLLYASEAADSLRPQQATAGETCNGQQDHPPSCAPDPLLPLLPHPLCRRLAWSSTYAQRDEPYRSVQYCGVLGRGTDDVMPLPKDENQVAKSKLFKKESTENKVQYIPYVLKRIEENVTD